MGKVISLAERSEMWSTAYASPDNNLLIMVSNHGRMKFCKKSAGDVCLEFVESVSLLSQLSSGIDAAMGILYEN